MRLAPPFISFLTDYGLADDFVGVCHGVIARICPEARVIDVTHGVPPQDVRAGALILARALPYLPLGVHLAVVDPGVGGPRRAIAVRTADGRHLVGPDNGLLWPAAVFGGGVSAAVDLAASPLALTSVSATFHGRDVFAPVAAGLAAGATVADVGEPVDPGSLVGLDTPEPRLVNGELVVDVVYVDRFGNLQLSARPGDLTSLGLVVGDWVVPRTDADCAHPVGRVRWGRTFGDVEPGELVLYEDAHGVLALAVNRGDAAGRLGLARGAELRISGG